MKIVSLPAAIMQRALEQDVKTWAGAVKAAGVN
jgi:hypothetical protein